MTRLLLALWCLLLLSGCGDGSSTQVSSNPTRLLATSSTVPADYSGVVQQLYVAYFGRPADAGGLTNFEAALVAAGAPISIQDLTAAYNTNATINGLINSFGTSTESNSLYAGDTTAFVKAVYNNVLNRAPQPAGLAFWVNAIDSGTLTKGNAALSIMAGALANTTAQGLIDTAAINNKITIASSFTNANITATQINAYKGSAAAATVRTMLATVNNTTDTTAFQSTVTSTIGTLVATADANAKIAPTLSVFAGNMGGFGTVNGTGSAARFESPLGIATDSAGNIYVADDASNTIRKITPAGVVTALAGTAGVTGSANGVGAAASFYHSGAVATDGSGNVYVADIFNHTIRKITSAGIVTTLAGTMGVPGSANGTGAAASFSYPNGISTDGAGNIYVADTGNSTIRKITPAGVVTTLAGTAGVTGSTNGTGSAARFAQPTGIAADSAGNVYVADTDNNTIRKITPAGVVTTLAGTAGVIGSSNGTGAAASFNDPTGVATDSAGNIYVADHISCTIRKITPAGVVTTLAGTAGILGSADGTGRAASFSYPTNIAVDTAGNIYVADTFDLTIRKITPTGVVTTLAGMAMIAGSADGTGAAATFGGSNGVATDSTGNIYIADFWNDTIRKITSAGVVTTLSGTAGATGSADGTGPAASFNSPNSVAADSAGNIYVADSGNNTIRKITSAGVVTTLSGAAGITGSADGTGPTASFNSPNGVATDSAGNIYVADSGNNTIRKITSAGVVTTLAGTAGVSGHSNGTGSAASFSAPSGIAIDSAGNIYVADSSNNTIRNITSAGVVTTLAGTAGVTGSADGTGPTASFKSPKSVAIDSAGNVYVTDSGNSTIRKITPAGVVTTVVGMPGQAGFIEGALPGILAFPNGVALSGTSLYITTAEGVAVVNNVP